MSSSYDNMNRNNIYEIKSQRTDKNYQSKTDDFDNASVTKTKDLDEETNAGLVKAMYDCR